MIEHTHPEDIIILGKADSGKLCNFDADEVWGVNNVAEHAEHQGKKFTKLFAFDLLPQAYTDGMKKYAPICSWQHYADLMYPVKEICEEFKSEYFTNTVSYMLAYAIYVGVKRIRMYGIDTIFGAPYAAELRGVEFWMGRAVDRGIKVWSPPESHLLETLSGVLYGKPNHCNRSLYLHERINLLNCLPKKGTYEGCLMAQNAWWVLFPKEDEAKANNVQVQRDPAGNLSFQTPKEFQSDIFMAENVWEFLKKILVDMEKAGELPYGALSVYEKLVLNENEKERDFPDVKDKVNEGSFSTLPDNPQIRQAALRSKAGV